MHVRVVQPVRVMIVGEMLCVVVSVIIVTISMLAVMAGYMVSIRIVVIHHSAVVVCDSEPRVDIVNVGIINDAIAVDVGVCAGIGVGVMNARGDVVDIAAINGTVVVGIDCEGGVVQSVVGWLAGAAYREP